MYGRRPLNSNEVRLVILHPASAESIASGKARQCIRCSTKVEPLKSRYFAWSYVWGSENQAAEMILNDEPFYITKNLHEALHNLRSKSKERVLWIDTLSINQSNLAERNDVVRNMQRIFERASIVIIWLGFDNLDRRKLAYQVLAHAKSGDLQTKLWNSKYQEFNERISALSPLLQNEYWHRLWTFQEVFYSRKSRLMWGKKTASYQARPQLLKL